jgi:ferredoxin
VPRLPHTISPLGEAVPVLHNSPTREAGTFMKIVTDVGACVGAGQCVVVSPTVFDLTEDGKVVVLDENPSAKLHEQVRNAAFACPAFAIELDES